MEEDDAYLGSVSYTLSNPFPSVESLQFSGYYNYVHHRMNNDHKPHRAGSGAGGGAQDGSGPGMQAGSGHPAGHGNGEHGQPDGMAGHGQNAGVTGSGHGDMAGTGHNDRLDEGQHMTDTGHGDTMPAEQGGHAEHAHPVRRIVFPLDA